MECLLLTAKASSIRSCRQMRRTWTGRKGPASCPRSAFRELAVALGQSLSCLGLSFVILKVSPDRKGNGLHNFKGLFSFQTRHFCEKFEMSLRLSTDQLESPAQESPATARAPSSAGAGSTMRGRRHRSTPERQDLRQAHPIPLAQHHDETAALCKSPVLILKTGQTEPSMAGVLGGFVGA